MVDRCFFTKTILFVLSALFAGTARGSESSGALPTIPPPNIPNNTFTITDYGAVADGATLNTQAFTKAIAAAARAGGGTVVIPPGKFLTAAFELTSNLNLQLERGATILFSNQFSDYALSNNRYPNLINAVGLHDVAITGEGTIDGQGKPWWEAFDRPTFGERGNPNFPHRPFLVSLRNCIRVQVQGVTLQNSPMFHLVPQSCRDVMIDHVTFLAPEGAANTDALDPSGWNYLITHCTFDVGDDCIAIKAGGPHDAEHLSCEDMLVTDCAFKHGHGMSIGSGTSGGLRRLVVRDSTFENTDAGIRLKSPRGRGGLVEDCTYEHLTMKNVKTPVYITSYYPERGTPKDPATEPAQPVTDGTPIWRHIRINNVTSVGSPTAGKIVGLPEMPVDDVVLTNVNITADKPFQIWNAKGIRFVNSQVTVSKGNAFDIQQAEVSGIDPKTGKPD